MSYSYSAGLFASSFCILPFLCLFFVCFFNIFVHTKLVSFFLFPPCLSFVLYSTLSSFLSSFLKMLTYRELIGHSPDVEGGE